LTNVGWSISSELDPDDRPRSHIRSRCAARAIFASCPSMLWALRYCPHFAHGVPVCGK
jgi:hypothetical protein